MKKYGIEFKVGLFVVLGILGLAYLVLSTGKVNFKKNGYYIYAVFNDISGLMLKAPVRLNGLEIGKVEDIALYNEGTDTVIKLKLWIDQKVKIRNNPAVLIKTLGMMGEKYVQISSSQAADYLAPDTVLSGKTPPDLDALLEQAQQILDNNQGGISHIVQNLESTSANFEAFSDDLKRHPWKLLFKGKEKPDGQKNR